MKIQRSLLLSLLFISSMSFADQESAVVAITGAYTESDEYLYGVSAYDTKGADKWGMYAEVLFAYKESDYDQCDTDCISMTLEDSDFSITVGADYGLTDSFYAVAGVGLRFETLSSEPSSYSCDDEDDDSSIDYSEYCNDESTINPVAQLGLLYVTPIGLSVIGTVDTGKTFSLGIGYQFK